MAAPAKEEIIAEVRRVVTGNAVELPDTTIIELASESRPADLTNWHDGQLDWNGLFYDCFVYIARNDNYMSETRGAETVSQPVAQRKAAYYKAQSPYKGGVAITVGRMARTDMLAPSSTGGEHGA